MNEEEGEKMMHIILQKCKDILQEQINHKEIEEDNKKRKEKEERINKRDREWVDEETIKHKKNKKEFEAYFTCKKINEKTFQINMYDDGDDYELPFCCDSNFIFVSSIIKTKSKIPAENIEIAKEKLIKRGYVEGKKLKK